MHLTPVTYSAVARAIGTVTDGDPRPAKRARLESVVAQSQPQNTRARLVRLPGWLSGKPTGGLRGQRGRGRGPWRGRGWRGAYQSRRY